LEIAFKREASLFTAEIAKTAEKELTTKNTKGKIPP